MEKVDFKTHIEQIRKPEFTNPINMNKDSIVVNNTHDVDEIWKILFEYLKMHNSERTMKTWYNGVYLEKLENGIAQLSCDNPVKREWIESNHRSFIRSKMEELIGYKPDLIISLRSSNSPSSKERDDKYEYYDPKIHSQGQQSLFESEKVQRAETQTPTGFTSNLNPKYLLSNFIVGSSNQLAHAVAEGVVDRPGSAYNPVFYYGPSGVGKTHLMQGIGNSILQKFPHFKVVYVPIETFMNDLIEAIRTRKNEEFRQKYRPIDVLIIDDIQFISTFKKTKEELFNTFNALYQANKQIIIASDRPPKEIENLPDRLRTRFEGGMVVDVQSPDLETRIAILRQRAKEERVEIDHEILMFIAQNIENSVRELEGAITKVITKARFTGTEPTVSDVAKMLQVDIDSKRKRIKPESILSAVAEVFDLTPREIRGKRRTAYVALARQTVMYILREELEMPLEKVAEVVNRKDHTTVLHACNKMEELIAKDEKIKSRVEKCKEILHQ